MNAVAAYLHLPLLAKELAERAVVRRTYMVRAIYATLFFGMFSWSFWRLMGEFNMERLGSGWWVLNFLTRLQIVGICLFLPAMMCGAVARERESGSLPLLLLTPMSPRRIILQKYLAGLVPMGTYLLLSLPLLAVAYALGGITASQIGAATVSLLLTACEVGAFTLLCSTCCGTVVHAFVTTYVAGALLFAGGEWLEGWAGYYWGTWSIFSFAPPTDLRGISMAMMKGYLPCLAITVLSLWLARIELHRGTFRAPRARRPIREWTISRAFRRINARVGGVVFGRSGALPENRPIVWREGRRFGLHTPVGALRLAAWLTALAGALFILLQVCGAQIRPYERVDWLSIVAAIFAVLPVLAIIPSAANAFTAERAKETLAVLLTTPVEPREIVAQKAKVLVHMQLAFIPPLAALFIGQTIAEVTYGNFSTGDPIGVWLASAMISLWVYPQVLVWVGLWIGLVCRTGRMALLVSIGVFGAVLFLPEWLMEMLDPLLYDWTSGAAREMIVHAASPLVFQAARLHRSLYMDLQEHWIGAAMLHFAFFTALALGFRRLCLSRADRHLRRRV